MRKAVPPSPSLAYAAARPLSKDISKRMVLSLWNNSIVFRFGRRHFHARQICVPNVLPWICIVSRSRNHMGSPRPSLARARLERGIFRPMFTDQQGCSCSQFQDSVLSEQSRPKQTGPVRVMCRPSTKCISACALLRTYYIQPHTQQ